MSLSEHSCSSFLPPAACSPFDTPLGSQLAVTFPSLLRLIAQRRGQHMSGGRATRCRAAKEGTGASAGKKRKISALTCRGRPRHLRRHHYPHPCRTWLTSPCRFGVVREKTSVVYVGEREKRRTRERERADESRDRQTERWMSVRDKTERKGFRLILKGYERRDRKKRG